ncbi:MAG: polysaccharide biosynthesis protein [Rhodobacteraceae bacterium]|nr:polysaccharide biosynthesis protein [Paracoccaceae bacterium]
MRNKLMKSLRHSQMSLVLAILDLVWITAAFAAAILLQRHSFVDTAPLTGYASYLLILLPAGMAATFFIGLRPPRPQTFSRSDIVDVTLFALFLGGVGLLAHLLPLPLPKTSVATFVVFALSLAVLRVGARMALRDKADLLFKPVDTTKILGRDALGGDFPAASEAYRDHCILVTGAGGSIGSELCRQLLSLKPKRLVLLDHSELALYTVHRELQALDDRIDIRPALGSIGSPEFVEQVLTDNNIEVIFHAAAYKHLPMVENNILEGLRNNVLGTRVVAEAARNKGVERFILVSSDKAVRPTSVMGSSKRLAELVVQDLATRNNNTRFSMVRFGNVLGSSGSVLPLFEAQIRHGGPLTVTHPDVTRYFMTLSEAVHLVLMAGSLSRGGDVFVLDMGVPVSILSVAKNMIEGAGYRVKDAQNPNGDIEIRFTGLRPGEKMHEELLIGSDMLTTPHPKILRAQESYLSEIEMAGALQDLRRAIETRDEALAMDTLTKYVESTLPSDNRHIAG